MNPADDMEEGARQAEALADSARALLASLDDPYDGVPADTITPVPTPTPAGAVQPNPQAETSKLTRFVRWASCYLAALEAEKQLLRLVRLDRLTGSSPDSLQRAVDACDAARAATVAIERLRPH